MWLYWSIAGGAFLAATVLPFYSEVLVVAAARQPETNLFLLWLFASVGNILGAVVNWALARFAMRWQDRRWFPMKPKQIAKAQAWFNRYGVWTLLLSWSPIGGDAITFIAGLMRVPLPIFLLLVGIGKAGRYAIVIGLTVASLG